MNRTSPYRTPGLLSVSRLVILAAAIATVVGCDSDGDAQYLSNLVTIADSGYTGIELRNGAQTLSVGEEATFTLHALTTPAAVINTEDVLTVGVTYTSSDSNTASVSSTGTIVGISDGEVTITADYGNLSYSSPLRVSSAALSTINIITRAGENFDIDGCGAIEINAQGIFAGEEDQPRLLTTQVEWDIDPTRGVFDANSGLLRVTSAGPLQVTATLDGLPGEREFTVLDNLAAIAIRAGDGEISVGSTQQFNALATYTDGRENIDITDNVEWQIRDDDATSVFATVDNTLPDKGLVTPSRYGDGILSAGCAELVEPIDIRSVGGGDIQQIEIARSSPYNIDFNGDEIVETLRAYALIDGERTREVTDDAEWEIVSTDSRTLLLLSDDDDSKGELTIKGTGTMVVIATFTDTDNDDEVHISPSLTIVSSRQ